MNTNFEALESVILTDGDYFIVQDKETGFKQRITKAELAAAIGGGGGGGSVLRIAGAYLLTDSHLDIFPISTTRKANQVGLFPEGTNVTDMSTVTIGIYQSSSPFNQICNIDPAHVTTIRIVREPVLNFIDDGATISWEVANAIPVANKPTDVLFNPIGGMNDVHAAAIGHGWLLDDWTYSPDRKTISYAMTVDGTDYGPEAGLFIEYAFVDFTDTLGNLYGILSNGSWVGNAGI